MAKFPDFIWKAPPAWEGQTFVILGNGPSLDPGEIEMCRDAARVIAINHTIFLAPWADVCYAGDWAFWHRMKKAMAWPGIKVGLAWDAKEQEYLPGWSKADFTIMHGMACTGLQGLEKDARGLRSGKNSGYQAINLAVHLGASKIILLGFDMKPKGKAHNWYELQSMFPEQPRFKPPYKLFKPHFKTLIKPLAARNIDIVNCTPGSALKAFRRSSLYAEL